MSLLTLTVFGQRTITIVLLLFFFGCSGNSGSSEDSPLSSQSKSPQELIQSAAEKQRIGAHDEAIFILRQALKSDPQFVPAYIQMGLVYSEADQRKEAIGSFNEALKIEPQNLKARFRVRGSLF